MKTLKYAVLCVGLLLSVQAHADSRFTCPQPSEITIWHTPLFGLWSAPPQKYSSDYGSGFGGNTVGALKAISSATVNGAPGWVCGYYSDHAPNAVILSKKSELPSKVQVLLESPALQDASMGVLAYTLDGKA